MQEIILVRGLPGSGKSTFARNIKQSLNAEHYEADMFFDFFHNGSYIAEKIKKAHNWCKSETKNAVTNGRSVIVANTFVKRHEMNFYLDLATEMGVPLKVVEVQGNWRSLHGVPPSKIALMRTRWDELPASFPHKTSVLNQQQLLEPLPFASVLQSN